MEVKFSRVLEVEAKDIYEAKEKAKIEALEAVRELEKYEETDAGLWDNTKSLEEQINIKATYTYANALTAKTEEAIKEAITQELAKEE